MLIKPLAVFLIALGGVVGVWLWADDGGGDEPEAVEEPEVSQPVRDPQACDLIAAPTGSDSAPGTRSRPLRTAQRLFDTLDSGETGCLRGGVYDDDPETKIKRPGITVTSYPGERAKLNGRLEVDGTATGVRLSELDFDGSTAPDSSTVAIYADDVVLRSSDITNGNRTICLKLGGRADRAERLLVEGNRIHDCGRLPPTNLDHGIYASSTQDLVVRANVIYANADRGVQLYPNSDHAQIVGNVIDGNGVGVIFSGADGEVSSDNLVEHNLITFSNDRDNVESFWNDGQIGTGNRVRQNCIYGGAEDNGDGGIETPQEGFAVTDNTIADPLYVNRRRGDFRLGPESPCAEIIADWVDELPLRPGPR